MSKRELCRRYAFFLMALVVGAFGVSLVTRSTLGVNSVACFSYVTSVYFPVTMGTITIAFNALMLVGQLFLFTKDERRMQLINLMMQVPAICVFGVMVDIWMYILKDLPTYNYAFKMGMLLIGSLVIALNIAMQTTASVAMLACDAFVLRLSQHINKKMGNVKLCYDLILVGTAAAMSFICSGFTEIVGIREGTVIGAIIVGPLAQRWLPIVGVFKGWLDPDGRAARAEAAKAAAQAEAAK